MSENTKHLILPYEVRGACVSASASITTGTNGVLLTGDADYRLDLVEVSFSNNSTVAASLSLKDDGTTVRTINVPIGGMVQLKFPIPLEQNAAGGDWTLDMEDITGTTVGAQAVFIKR